jgi:pimeloyl-ACP methyl ester carboxylesterase
MGVPTIQRRYVDVLGRRVLYRRVGSGPPLVMLHGSPGNGEVLYHEMMAAAEHFTVFALDTPGFGDSDPLPGEVVSVADLAHATAVAMAALGLPPCLIFGTHTGALIAAELGAGWPDSATALVMEGLPIFTDDEIKALFEGYGDYFAPMVPDPLGGHLIQTWIRFRDQFTWFPWRSRDVTRLNPVDRPTPEEIQLWTMMFYQSCSTYSAAYRAACYHGHRAYLAAERITLPAIYMASAEDMLYPHLDRLPPMKPGQRIERLAYDPPAKYRAIAAFARSLPQGAPIGPEVILGPAGHDPAVQFIDAPAGQIFIRCYGLVDAPALVLLHDAPGSGLALEPLARMLAQDFRVIVPDLPGCGNSEAPDGPPLEAAADALAAIADAFALPQFAIAANGCSAAVATTFAARGDPRLTVILLDTMPAADLRVAESIAPDLPLTPEGSHWITAWLMVRDGQIYSPWFEGTIAAQRKTQGNFDAQWLHDQTCEIMKARRSYHLIARTAWRTDAAALLANAAAPVHVAPDGDLTALIQSQLLAGSFA